MKKVFFYFATSLLAVSAFMFSCQKESSTDITAKTEQSLLKENLAILDLRVRTLDKDMYVKEVVLQNFSSEPFKKDFLTIKGKNYSDDGTSNDLIAGDGIFTSSEQYSFDNIVKFDKNQTIRSLSGRPIVDPEFKNIPELRKIIESYSYYDQTNNVNGRKPALLEVTCPITFGTSGCPAERAGWCKSCCFFIDFSKCSVTFGF
jgi:hypothetical protein